MPTVIVDGREIEIGADERLNCIEAARRAGMDAVALTTTLPAAAFDGYPNLRHPMADFVGFRPDTVTRENTHA